MGGGDIIESVGRNWSDAPRRAAEQAVPAERLKTHWFTRWERALDDALFALPTLEDCRSDLYRDLSIAREGQNKRIGLVLDGEDPVMVAVLRADASKGWRAAAEDISKSAAFPARSGGYFAATTALGVELSLSYAVPPEPLPVDPRLRAGRTLSTYSLDLTLNPERHWRASGHLPTALAAREVAAERRRYLLFDAPGQTEWTFRRAALAAGADKSRLIDLEIAAGHFAAIGRRRTATLYEGDQAIAAAVFLTGDNALTTKLVHVEDAADKLALASLHDQTIIWARSQGYARINYGAFTPLARRIAPVSGSLCEVDVAAPGRKFSETAREGLKAARASVMGRSGFLSRMRRPT